MAEIINCALAYAKQGMHVFRLEERSKIPPRAYRWKQEATTDPEKIQKMFRPNSNLGIVTGKRSGIFVLDVDSGDEKAGWDSLHELTDGHSELPDTYVVDTPSGGAHYYFRYPEGKDIRNSAGKIGKGLDIRGNGGYVVAPPSVTEAGAYTWKKQDIAEAPEWLIAFAETASSEQATEERGNVEGKIPEGERNSRLTSIAGALRRQGCSADDILTALKSINRTRLDSPLKDSELRVIADSMMRYEPQQEKPQEKPQEISRPSGSTIQILGPWEQADYAQEKLKKQIDPVLKWSSFSPDLDDENILGPMYSEEINLMIAAPGAGKTDAILNVLRNNPNTPTVFVSLDMPVQNVKARQVQMLTGSGKAKSRELIRNGMIDSTIRAFEHVHILYQPATLPVIARSFREYRERVNIPFQLVVIDYLQILEGPGKTEAEKIIKLANTIGSFRTAIGCAVLVLVQTIKKECTEELNSTDFSGSNQIQASADGALLLWRDVEHGHDDKLAIKVGKARDGKLGHTVAVRHERPSRNMKPFFDGVNGVLS